jgi:hypothetical protein
MCSPPAWLLIEPLLVPRDAIPTQEVRAIVFAYRLDYVHGFAVATFATMGSVMFDAHGLISAPAIIFFCLMNANLGNPLIF